MTLAENMYKINSLWGKPNTSREIGAIQNAILDQLKKCEDPNEIEDLLKADVNFHLFSEIQEIAFEKLLGFGVRTPWLLRKYATHISMYYRPEDEKSRYKEKLSEEADNLEQNENKSSTD